MGNSFHTKYQNHVEFLTQSKPFLCQIKEQISKLDKFDILGACPKPSANVTKIPLLTEREGEKVIVNDLYHI